MRKFKILFQVMLVLNFTLVVQGYSQHLNFNWVSTLEEGNADIARAVSISDAGEVYMIGASQESGHSENGRMRTANSDIVINEITNIGKASWTKKAGSSIGHSNAIDEYGTDIIFKSDYLYITGVYNYQGRFDGAELMSKGLEDIFIGKYRKNGELIWMKSIGGVSQDLVYDMALDSDDNIYITGSIQHDAQFGDMLISAGDNAQFFIAKYSSGGDLLWCKYSSGNGRVVGKSVYISAGNIYIAGEFTGNSTIGNNTLVSNGQTDIFLAKMDLDGGLKQITTVGGEEEDRVESMVATNKGEIYFCGSFTGFIIHQEKIMQSNGLHDVLLGKLSPNLTIEWMNTYGGVGMDVAHAVEIVDDEIVVAGTFEKELRLNGESHWSFGFTDIFLVDLDSKGNVSWLEVIGGAGQNHVTDLRLKNNELYLSGFFIGDINFNDESSYSEKASSSFLFNFSLGKKEESQPSISDVVIYPNPAKSNITIRLTGEAASELKTIRVLNTGGLIRYEKQSIESEVLDINTEGYSPGMYFVEVQSQSTYFLRKIIIM
ncbi:T9SS type A sorting domain-containing protein [Fulvivirga sp. 29W222]|uniref:T9SS type A sorting domain-containing protein n=1 Tax=Fulvivirga marina TaxID=2494733 RepID=A0A937G2D0_9BACT|nr:T9SS type A sorting domain-containing protein [Fulvivirga marina]MBL6448710.1 T9SS type A sorting domain-containing protein [Fulvivirga marina]